MVLGRLPGLGGSGLPPRQPKARVRTGESAPGGTSSSSQYMSSQPGGGRACLNGGGAAAGPAAARAVAGGAPPAQAAQMLPALMHYALPALPPPGAEQPARSSISAAPAAGPASAEARDGPTLPTSGGPEAAAGAQDEQPTGSHASGSRLGQSASARRRLRAAVCSWGAGAEAAAEPDTGQHGGEAGVPGPSAPALSGSLGQTAQQQQQRPAAAADTAAPSGNTPHALPAPGAGQPEREQEQQQEQEEGRGEAGPASTQRRAKRARLSTSGAAASPGGRGEGASTPAGGRGRGRGRGKKRGRGVATPNSKYAELIGRIVEVPGSLFSVDVPGMIYRGRITKHETSRKQDAMEVRFLDDGSKYWFPIEDIWRWLGEMEARGAEKETAAGIASNKAADEFAASVLTDLATGSIKSGKGGSQVSDAAVPVAARPAARALPSPVEEEEQDPIGEEGRGLGAAGLAGQEAAGLPDGGDEEEEAVSSKRRRMEAGGRGRGRGRGGRGRGGRGRGSRGGHAQAHQPQDGDSGDGPASSLHVMADAADMNQLSLPPPTLDG